jgi:hypothetical protein
LLHVLMAAIGTKLPIRNVRYMAAFGGDPDIEPTLLKDRVWNPVTLVTLAARDRNLVCESAHAHPVEVG